MNRPRSGHYPRDVVGYGSTVPAARWPGNARIAVQFVLNYEEGAENSVLHGDEGSEQFLSEMFSPPAYPARYMSMESIYEYGSRAGVWRLLREFERRRLPLTVFGVGMALERHPELVRALVEQEHEIAAHGWRWINYQTVDEQTERLHLALAVDTITRLTGTPPRGLVHRQGQPEHAAAGRRPRRLRVRQRQLRRRPSVLDIRHPHGRHDRAAPGCAVHARYERHAVCAASGLLPGGGLLHVRARRV